MMIDREAIILSLSLLQFGKKEEKNQ